jgi:hypothetical protein
VGGGLVGDGVALAAEGVEDVLEVEGVEDHHGVGDEREAERLFGLLVIVAAPPAG